MPTETEIGNRLSDMEFDEIALCKKGMNQGAQVVLYKSDSTDDYEKEYIEKRQFTNEKRQALADKGQTAYGLSFPIETLSDLDNAISAWGRAPDSRRAMLKRFMLKMAKKLDASQEVIDRINGLVAKAGASCSFDHRTLTKGERCPECGMKSTGRSGRMKKMLDLIKSLATDEVLTSNQTDRAEFDEWMNDQDELIHTMVENGDTLPTNTNKPEERMPGTKEGKKEIDKSALDPEVVAYLEELEKDNVDLAEALQEAEEAIAEAGKIDDDDKTKLGKSDDDKTKEALAKADPELRAIIEKAQADAESAKKQAEDAIAKAEEERSQRMDREFVSKAQTEYKHLPNVKPEDFGPLLRKMFESSPEVYEKISEVLKAADEMIRQGEVMKEQGRGGARTADANGAIEKVNAKAEELRKSDAAITIEQAKAKVLAEDPDLYAEYRTEMQGRK